MNPKCPLTLYWIQQFVKAKQNLLWVAITHSSGSIDMDVQYRVAYFIKQIEASRNKTLSWFMMEKNRPNIFDSVRYCNVTISLDIDRTPLIPRHLRYNCSQSYRDRYPGRQGVIYTQSNYFGEISMHLRRIEKRCLEGNDFYCHFLYTLLLIYDERIGRKFSQELIDSEGMRPYWNKLRDGQKNIYRCQRSFICDEYYTCDEIWYNTWRRIIDIKRLGFVLP